MQRISIQEQSASELVTSAIHKQHGTTDWLYPGCWMTFGLLVLLISCYRPKIDEFSGKET